MTCVGCGACCRDHVPVASTDVQVPLELTDLDARQQRWMKQGTVAPWCVALDLATRTCTIYERRPRVCRDFKVGGRACYGARAKCGTFLRDP